jgi:lipopolysaccharide export system protein LptA
MRNVCLGLFLCSLPLQSVEIGDSPVVVDAQFGYYDGHSIHLQGEVVLEHDLGTVSADEAMLSPALVNDKSHFSLLNLSDSIHVLLEGGGRFYCSQAELDFRTLTGCFTGSEEQRYVTYTDTVNDEGASIILRGERMMVVMNELSLDNDEPVSHQVQQIMADDHVTVDYNHEFMAAGDHLIYQRHAQVTVGNDAPMPGTIYLRPDLFHGTCQVTNASGDMIKAQEIGIDIPKQEVAFVDPRGAIYFSGIDDKRKRLDFSAAQLKWDNPTNVLTLRKDVVLYQNEMGKLTSDQVEVCQRPGGGLQELEWIRAKGKTEMTYDDPIQDDSHYLVCHGEVFIDTSQRVTILSSPMKDGTVLPENQVYFRDKRGSVYADKARLDYDTDGKNVSPRKLTLASQVRLINRTVDGQTVTGRPLQYALADVLEYLPVQQQMLLYADEDGRVLVYDRLNSVQISAPAVNIRRDGTTGKEAIEGLGDVRFCFAEGEQAMLMEQFANEESIE